jgi:hypothetical protein
VLGTTAAENFVLAVQNICRAAVWLQRWFGARERREFATCRLTAGAIALGRDDWRAGKNKLAIAAAALRDEGLAGWISFHQTRLDGLV